MQKKCNEIFWIGNDPPPPPFRNFPKIHPFSCGQPSLRLRNVFQRAKITDTGIFLLAQTWSLSARWIWASTAQMTITGNLRSLEIRYNIFKAVGLFVNNRPRVLETLWLFVLFIYRTFQAVNSSSICIQICLFTQADGCAALAGQRASTWSWERWGRE